MMTFKHFKLVTVLCMLISIQYSHQSVVKEVRKNLPNVDSSLDHVDKSKLDLVIPRREDDYAVLANGAYEVVNQDKVTATTDSSDMEQTTGQVPDQGIKSAESESDEMFAVFGSRHRPQFPVDELPVTVTANNVTENPVGNSSSTEKPIEEYVPPGNTPTIDGFPLPNVGLIDVSLAQLANIKVLTNGTSQIDVFVSRNGLNCTCGTPTPTHRIVNGLPVKINELPWTAALFKKNWLGFYGQKPFCGGSLINDRYVITASHCVDGASARSLKIRLNEEDVSKLNENVESSIEVQVEKIIMHDQYNRRNIDNDLALLKLATPVKFSEDSVIAPVCLPASNTKDMSDQVATVAGWGAISQYGSTSQVLRKVQVPIMSNQDCNTKTVYTGKITPNMMCAGYLEGGRDSCQGDSGGPLVVQNDGRHTLVGIVSWGYGCAKKNSPGVYTRVARYPDYILSHTKDAMWCQS